MASGGDVNVNPAQETKVEGKYKWSTETVIRTDLPKFRLGLNPYQNQNRKTEHTETEIETETEIVKTSYLSSEELLNSWLDRGLTTKRRFKLKTHTTYIKKIFDEKCLKFFCTQLVIIVPQQISIFGSNLNRNFGRNRNM